MRSFVLALFAFTVASVQLANAAATIPDYRARVNTGLVKADPRDANASTVKEEKAKAPPVRFYETPARH
jgi:hypothetical protein